MAMSWDLPSMVCTVTLGEKFCGLPCDTRTSPTTMASGSSTAGRIPDKVPIEVAQIRAGSGKTANKGHDYGSARWLRM